MINKKNKIMKFSEQWVTLRYKDQVFPFYEISNTGRIRSVSRIQIDKNGRFYYVNGTLLTPRTNKKEPYLFIEAIYTDKKGDTKRKTVYVHRAVYESFYVNYKISKMYISHKDDDTFNNNLSNLYPITHSELQYLNLEKHPKNRWRLDKWNKAHGYKFNGKKKINENKILAIEELSRKYKAKVIAEMVGVSLATVYKYKNSYGI